VSIRPRRALVGLVLAAAAFVALPASALAAGETVSVSPSPSSQAGSNETITDTLHFAPAAGDSPQTVVLSTSPGLLANLNANVSCLASQQFNASCQIGTETLTIMAGPTPTMNSGTLYLGPAASGSHDLAGIYGVFTGTPTPSYTGVSLNPSAPGGLTLTGTLPDVRPDAITDATLVINSTLNGQPFTRLPSSCAAGTNTMNVTYYGGATGSATSSLTPTGCSSLPYAPKLMASITKDASGSGATLVTEITQAANESASKTIVLQFPAGLKPNVGVDIPCLTGTGCTVGSATATSPLVPSAALSNGKVTLAGLATAPTIAITFPSLGITIPGNVSLTSNSVTFPTVPDVPLTDLKLTITGPSGGKAFTTDCAPANIGGTFTPWSGTAPVSDTSKIAFSNCVSKPTASGSTVGLAKGQPKLKFTITHGKGAAKVAAVAIGLPGGLKFSRSAIVQHKTCTTLKNKKKKCTTTTLIKGLGVAGGKAKTVAIKNGRLVVTLKKGSNKVTLTISGPLVTETKGLQTKVKKHKTKTLNFTLKVTDAKHTATTLPLKLKAH
jgi:hypothetical protein